MPEECEAAVRHLAWEPPAAGLKPIRCACLALAVAWIAVPTASCTGSTTFEDSGSPDGMSSGLTLPDVPLQLPDRLLQLQDDPGLLSDIPEVVASETRADSGLQIAYTRAEQVEAVPPGVIEAQWLHMQSCLELIASPPLVVVRNGPVRPFTSTDDVIHDIEGIPMASASRLESAIVQVRDNDFDGSVGNPGFNLRSILGRLLWLSAALPERDYPYSCAREHPESL